MSEFIEFGNPEKSSTSKLNMVREDSSVDFQLTRSDQNMVLNQCPSIKQLGSNMKTADRYSKFLSKSTLQKNTIDSIDDLKNIPQLQTDVDGVSPNIKQPEFTPVHRFGLSNIDAESSNVVIGSGNSQIKGFS